MQPAPTPESTIDAAITRLTAHYHAKGDLELHFIRQIAGAQFTLDALQRALNKISTAGDPDDRRVDRITKSQARTQRMHNAALKELKDLQTRRGLQERFPEQTKDAPPLADHTPHVGYNAPIMPLPRRRTDPRPPGTEPRTGPSFNNMDYFRDPAFIAKYAPQLMDKIPGMRDVPPGK
ncbi:MAG: hypothetical protein ABI972_06465 [Acidobacteriota bacterium]